MPYTDINLLPLGKTMTFAEFVLNDIEQNGAVIVEGFMGDEFIVPSRLFNTERDNKGYPSWSCVKERANKDDWSLSTGWNLFGHWADIFRGTDNFLVKVRGKEALALRNVEARLCAKRKFIKEARKAERKKKELDAAWWP